MTGLEKIIDSMGDLSFFAYIYRYVFSAPNKLLDSMPGTLMLTDCLEACQNNDSCASVNYETGLCVLFSSNSDKLPGKFVVLLASPKGALLHTPSHRCCLAGDAVRMHLPTVGNMCLALQTPLMCCCCTGGFVLRIPH